MSIDPFDAFIVELEEHKRQMRDYINRDLFRDGATGPSVPIVPIVRPSRLARATAAVRAYTVTLWRAIRGDDPYADECNGY